MPFIQVIEFRTSKLEEVRALGDEWEAAAGADRLARRRVTCADRDDPKHIYNIVFFDSYEEAMKNSELPSTTEFSGRMMKLADGPPTFHNLDVVDDKS